MQETYKLGLGTMGMSLKNKEQSIETIHKALEEGVTIFNTGDFYCKGESQVVLGEALKGIPRDRYFISLKFGVSFTENGAFLDVKPENIKNHLLVSLEKMGLDYVDLYQPARQDLAIPVEDIMQVMKELVNEGYIKHIGLSEVDADTLRRAHKVHPIHSVEVEYSLLNREIEKELISTAKELGVNIVAYGAVGHGILTERIFDETLANPMVSRGVLSEPYKEQNLIAFNEFKSIAEEIGVSMSELALAWTQAKYDNIISLIGTTNPKHLQNSIEAMALKLKEVDVARIENTISSQRINGLVSRKWIFENGIGRFA